MYIKPRIKIVSNRWYWVCWKCTSIEGIGWGRTPEEAYRDWKIAKELDWFIL